MTRMTQDEQLELYTRSLSTMTEVLSALRDEPDPDGALTDLAYRIEAEREWVRASMALGEAPRRPLGWLRRLPDETRTEVSASRPPWPAGRGRPFRGGRPTA